MTPVEQVLIPFNRYFYQYQPTISLMEIDVGLGEVSAEIMNQLQEVYS
ncbi:MAG: hypothetical protein JKY76_01055 [Proteobacteria bacterium]|nr:hypothetical protein [Pseudomonadota bacterium]